jgi:hypothetical protein
MSASLPPKIFKILTKTCSDFGHQREPKNLHRRLKNFKKVMCGWNYFAGGSGMISGRFHFGLNKAA